MPTQGRKLLVVKERSHASSATFGVGRLNPPTLVYFIQQGVNGPIKIGVSGNPEQRLRTLQTANIMDLSLLRTIPGTKHTEIQWHRRFRHLQVHGEWFHPAPELLEAIFEREYETLE